jgi:hypothetical protein
VDIKIGPRVQSPPMSDDDDWNIHALIGFHDDAWRVHLAGFQEGASILSTAVIDGRKDAEFLVFCVSLSALYRTAAKTNNSTGPNS